MAPLSAELSRRGYREWVVHTGQHYDDNMSAVFFHQLAIREPDARLQVSGRSHGRMTAEMLVALEEMLLEKRPPFVLLYGDTNSTLAGALAAVKLRIPLAHVEAGPRLHDLDTPEEINRIVTDHASRMRFCPDSVSVDNLNRENQTTGVYFSGDVMYDAFLTFSPVAQNQSPILRDLALADKRFALLTVHRPNNTDSPEAVRRLVELLEATPLPVVFTVHPRTEAALKRHGAWRQCQSLPRARLIPAVGYLDLLCLLNACEIVLTDSGGLQKEAFFAGKPAVILFYSTPWPQIRDCGWQRCAWKDGGLDVAQALHDLEAFRPHGSRPELFGDGRAARRIVDLLEGAGWLAGSHSQVLQQNQSAA
jgi:UDP-N-acetylglucosamine 2-epimerase